MKTEYTPTKITKFVEAFNNGYSIAEACQYAGVHRDTYYSWIKKYPGFEEKMNVAKLMINRRAKEIVVKSIIDGNTSNAKWWLEHKDPDFKNKSAVELNPAIKTFEDKIKDFLDDPAIRPESLPDDSEEVVIVN